MKVKYSFFILFIFYSVSFSAIKQYSAVDSIAPDKIYRYYAGEVNGYKVWIVDGFNIRTNIFGEFIYGGNSARYPFIPVGEIWIDNAISANEYITTLEHEINECNLMYHNNMDYYDAHDSSLSLELKIRQDNYSLSKDHESKLPMVSPLDFDSVKEISTLNDMIKLENVYINKFISENGFDIWIVDGYNIRKSLYPDFGFSGNYSAYMFIPKNEIWIDGNVSCEEIWYSISLEENESKLMNSGVMYDAGYEEALKIVTEKRNSDQKYIRSMPYLKYMDPLYRDKVK
jgi:hypothetical protein